LQVGADNLIRVSDRSFAGGHVGHAHGFATPRLLYLILRAAVGWRGRQVARPSAVMGRLGGTGRAKPAHPPQSLAPGVELCIVRRSARGPVVTVGDLLFFLGFVTSSGPPVARPKGGLAVSEGGGRADHRSGGWRSRVVARWSGAVVATLLIVGYLVAVPFGLVDARNRLSTAETVLAVALLVVFVVAAQTSYSIRDLTFGSAGVSAASMQPTVV
jgi:hypothetical protein